MSTVLVVALGAGGVLLFCWCILGWLLLPAFGEHACFLLRYEGDAPTMEQDFRTYQWMQGSGILRGRLLVIDDGMSDEAMQRLVLLLTQTKNARLCIGFPKNCLTETENL